MLLAIPQQFISHPPAWFYLIPITLIAAVLLTILHAYSKSDYKPKEPPKEPEPPIPIDQHFYEIDEWFN